MTSRFFALHQATVKTPVSIVSPGEPAAVWPASYMGGLTPVDPETWTLEVAGLVEAPGVYTPAALQAISKVREQQRIVSQDGWSFQAEWEGVLLQDLLAVVKPTATARYLWQINALGQAECLSLEAIQHQRALLVYGWNGTLLSSLYGGPMRLMVFNRYLYKSLPQLVRLVFSETEAPNLSAEFGLEKDGLVQPGSAYAFDQGVNVPVG